MVLKWASQITVRIFGVVLVAVMLSLIACVAPTDESVASVEGDRLEAPVNSPTEETNQRGQQRLPIIVTDARGVAVTVTSTDRIVAVDGVVAEVLFDLGFGSSVVATDISATYPQEADALPEIGYQRSLSAEPVAKYEPTLVLTTDAAPPETIEDLEKLNYPVVVIPSSRTRDGPGQMIRAVGDAEAASDEGEKLARDVETQLEETSSQIEGSEQTPQRVLALYIRGENVQLVLGAGGGVDWLIELAGAKDVGTELGVTENAPLNSEAIVAARPEVLLVPQRGLDSVGGIDGLLSIPGLAETPAGQNRTVLVYDDQYLLGNGPRSGLFLKEFITDLQEVSVEQ